ncbi:cytidylate kinase [Clostridium sp. CAG:411]|jgi:cytidylate kinase|nr:(d)CMP kinase [Lachnospiraceae bacterium]CDE47493.1 cytidylate kinase [Clostridium sp. CAG:411]
MAINIAIDGPAGAGKSTIAKMVAKELGFIYVDTGAMYRAIALYMLRNNMKQEEEVATHVKEASVEIVYQNGEQQVVLNGENVSGLIRTEEVGKMASFVAKIKEVRAQLLDLQRNLAAKENVIMDGRDIGTHVLPNADVKIYLTASASERANRRYKELCEKGIACNLQEIENDIIARDEQDMNREIAPLKQAEDAVLVDSSHMTIAEVVENIIAIYKKNV